MHIYPDHGTITGQTQLYAAHKGQKTLTMIRNDRMAGSVPSWQKMPHAAPKTQSQQQNITSSMERALNNGQSFSHALALHQDGLRTQEHAQSKQNMNERAFGFGDLVDMINPLHHIPLVGSVYRAITGDEIHPVSRVIGGGVFGGVIGAASGLVNAVVEEETGRDIPENALAFLRDDPPQTSAERNIAQASALSADDIGGRDSRLPASVLAFADMGAPYSPSAKTVQQHQQHTAPTITQSSYHSADQKVAFREL